MGGSQPKAEGNLCIFSYSNNTELQLQLQNTATAPKNGVIVPERATEK